MKRRFSTTTAVLCGQVKRDEQERKRVQMLVLISYEIARELIRV